MLDNYDIALNSKTGSDLDWPAPAMFYYRDAYFSNGDKGDSAEDAIDEVAGEYVGYRGVTVWKAWGRIDLLGLVAGKRTVRMRNGLISNSPVAPLSKMCDRCNEHTFFMAPDQM